MKIIILLLIHEAIKACVSLTERYITDRHLPDKAIDALDEVGSRVHLTNINVPKGILDVEKKIEDLKEQKNEVIKSQQYEKAAELRDEERKLMEELEVAKASGKRNLKTTEWLLLRSTLLRLFP